MGITSKLYYLFDLINAYECLNSSMHCIDVNSMFTGDTFSFEVRGVGDEGGGEHRDHLVQ
jgi:hypothetical protein